jgi:integral membrane protein
MLKTPIGQLRITGFIEGVSFLLLLGIAMPLKYLAGFPAAVKIVGIVHGILFMLYIASVIHVKVEHRRSIVWMTGAFVAAILPFGTFVLDRQLRQMQ